jgi:hypothetical protein
MKTHPHLKGTQGSFTSLPKDQTISNDHRATFGSGIGGKLIYSEFSVLVCAEGFSHER